MANTIIGRIYDAGRTETVRGRAGELAKRTVVLDASRHDAWTGERLADNYPSFELTGERTALADGLAAGQLVQVHFDVRGRRWTDADGNVKFFNTLSAYRIEPYARRLAPRPAEDAETEAARRTVAEAARAADAPGTTAAGGDELPF